MRRTAEIASMMMVTKISKAKRKNMKKKLKKMKMKRKRKKMKKLDVVFKITTDFKYLIKIEIYLILLNS